MLFSRFFPLALTICAFDPTAFAAEKHPLGDFQPRSEEARPSETPSDNGWDTGGGTAATSFGQDFLDWENEVTQAKLVEAMTAACKAPATGTKLAVWCGDYFSSRANRFDVSAILRSRPISVATYYSARERLGISLRDFKSAIEQRVTELDPAKASDKGELDLLKNAAARPKALLAGSSNALPGVLGAAGLAGIDVDALAQQLFEGLGEALRERAEQEAIAYVLEQVNSGLCNPEKGRDEMLLWLPATCRAARSGAFSGSRASSAQAALALFQDALERDLRKMPSTLARKEFEHFAKNDPAKPFAVIAPDIERLVDEVVTGIDPVIALDHFGGRLLRRTEIAYESQETIEVVSCASSIPASTLRARGIADSRLIGLDPTARGETWLLLSLAAPGCDRLLKRKAGKGHTSAVEARLWTWTTYAASFEDLGVAFAQTGESLADAAKALENAASSFDPKTLVSDSAARMAAAGSATRAGKSLLASTDSADIAVRALEAIGVSQTIVENAQSAIDHARASLQLAVLALSGDVAATFEMLLSRARLDVPSGGRDCATDWCIDVPAPLIQYGGLIVSLANARSSEEVKTAILAASAPVGSWRAKQDPAAGPVVTFGGLVGPVAYLSDRPSVIEDPSGNYVTDDSPDGIDKDRGGFGVTAAAGVDWVPKNLIWNGGSVSFFGQILDLGGYLNIAPGEESPRTLQAVSPGVLLKVTLPRSPVVVAVGVAHDFDDGSPLHRERTRGIVTISVDATLFVLHRN